MGDVDEVDDVGDVGDVDKVGDIDKVGDVDKVDNAGDDGDDNDWRICILFLERYKNYAGI